MYYPNPSVLQFKLELKRSRTSDMGFVAARGEDFAARRQRAQAGDSAARALQATLMTSCAEQKRKKQGCDAERRTSHAACCSGGERRAAGDRSGCSAADSNAVRQAGQRRGDLTRSR